MENPPTRSRSPRSRRNAGATTNRLPGVHHILDGACLVRTSPDRNARLHRRQMTGTRAILAGGAYGTTLAQRGYCTGNHGNPQRRPGNGARGQPPSDAPPDRRQPPTRLTFYEG
jgi:hypothetical protein